MTAPLTEDYFVLDPTQISVAADGQMALADAKAISTEGA